MPTNPDKPQASIIKPAEVEADGSELMNSTPSSVDSERDQGNMSIDNRISSSLANAEYNAPAIQARVDEYQNNVREAGKNLPHNAAIRAKTLVQAKYSIEAGRDLPSYMREVVASDEFMQRFSEAPESARKEFTDARDRILFKQGTEEDKLLFRSVVDHIADGFADEISERMDEISPRRMLKPSEDGYEEYMELYKQKNSFSDVIGSDSSGIQSTSLNDVIKHPVYKDIEARLGIR